MPTISRRQILLTGAAATASFALPGGLARPYLSRAADRPLITHGLQTGDIGSDAGMIWARADRPSQMMVEISTTESFKNARTLPALTVDPEGDFTGKLLVDDLPSGQDIFYRVRFRDIADVNVIGEPLVGRFRTAPGNRRGVKFTWSGDTAGQGWGIDADRGGMKAYATMLKHQPDFFIHSGDTVYADGPLKSEVKLPDGTMWKNVTTEEKSKVAETLSEYRGQYKYNLMDENVRAFNAAVPIYAQWDDHEVTNNWSSSKILGDAYKEKNIGVLAARAARAFHEMMPLRTSIVEPRRVYRRVNYGPLLDIFFLDMRTYRGPNTANGQTKESAETVFLGAEQIAWLKRELLNSRATWKVIAADMPLGLIVPDKQADGSMRQEGVAQGNGAPAGREHEFAHILSFMKHAGIKNTVWLTADVHYTAAHYYDPDKAQFQDFDPFWEFVSGPIHSGTFGPNELENTFGPQLRYVKAPENGQANLSPAAGLQFFGLVAIDGDTEQMTVTLKDVADADLWSITLDPQRA
ncbi:alkaline phosphatase D family protein [Flaviflagellibacter deserti]|uniref:Alkaline phosphatase D family protein n=1 Tax=Flaviflagellibacter deserti TaxID=2267266 RepID=A0ABV9Z3E0_9HYPH